jgi:GNAT superfamily N-acetyltransferase
MGYSMMLTEVVDDELRKAILAPLVVYNDSQVGPSRGRPLAVAIGDETGAVIGGLWGSTGYGWLFTQLLVVPEQFRRQGVGTRLMQMAEQEALARGCRGAWLDTFDFQARGFYERLGYTCFGEIPNYPLGHSRYFMKKELQPPVPGATE